MYGFGRLVRVAFGTASSKTQTYMIIPATVYSSCLGLFGLYCFDFKPILSYLPSYKKKEDE